LTSKWLLAKISKERRERVMLISKTPMRISFAGGGSDFKDYYQNGYGSVLSTAIDKYVYVYANKMFDSHIRVGYSKTEYVSDIEEVEHNLVREALKLVGLKTGIDIVYMADMLPEHIASGLGASSTLTVGILNALHALKGERVSAATLAREACEIEIEILGRPIGKQDQYIAAYGGFSYIRFDSDEGVVVEPILCKQETKNRLARNLLLLYTGMKSKSDGVLTEQKSKTPENRSILDRMVDFSEELREALVNNDLSNFGRILHEGWMHKRELASNITNTAIDGYYEKALNAGASGGKILGSGGGGFLLLYCEEAYQDSVRKALPELKEANFSLSSHGSGIIFISD